MPTLVPFVRFSDAGDAGNAVTFLKMNGLHAMAVDMPFSRGKVPVVCDVPVLVFRSQLPAARDLWIQLASGEFERGRYPSELRTLAGALRKAVMGSGKAARPNGLEAALPIIIWLIALVVGIAISSFLMR